MDRRRFVPSAEGLEQRTVLSSLFTTTPTNSNNAAQDVPVTFAQKELRIAHLPYYMENLLPGRPLPKDLVLQLQEDLLSIAGRLHKPNYETLVNFNTNLRDITPDVTLSVADAKVLSQTFTTVISDTGATAQQVTNLQTDMLNFAKVDSTSSEPVFLASNDYSVVLQTILGVGRPIQTPQSPQIAKADGIRVSPALGKTANHQPEFVGQYGAGASVGVFAGGTTGGFNSDGVTMQIVDEGGTVLGEGPVNPKNGDYRVKFANPMPDGVYKLHARAVDAEGHVSNPSRPYMLKIVSRPTKITGMATPAGPRALAR